MTLTLIMGCGMNDDLYLWGFCHNTDAGRWAAVMIGPVGQA